MQVFAKLEDYLLLKIVVYTNPEAIEGFLEKKECSNHSETLGQKTAVPQSLLENFIQYFLDHGRNGYGKKGHSAGQAKRKPEKNLMFPKVGPHSPNHFFVFTFFHNG